MIKNQLRKEGISKQVGLIKERERKKSSKRAIFKQVSKQKKNKTKSQIGSEQTRMNARKNDFKPLKQARKKERLLLTGS